MPKLTPLLSCFAASLLFSCRGQQKNTTLPTPQASTPQASTPSPTPKEPSKTTSGALTLTGRPLTAIWGSSSSDVYAVGDGVILRSQDGGKKWTDVTPSGPKVSLTAVWGAGSDIYAVGEGGKIL